MLEDLKRLIAEFDLGMVTHPQSVEQFLMGAGMIIVVVVLGVVVFRLIAGLF